MGLWGPRQRLTLTLPHVRQEEKSPIVLFKAGVPGDVGPNLATKKIRDLEPVTPGPSLMLL